MANIQSGLACPLCDQRGVTSELYQTPGVLAVRCPADPSHSFPDIDGLHAMNARKLAQHVRPEAIQQNHVSITLSMPKHVADALKDRYGDKLSVSATAVLRACLEPRALILTASNLDRLEEKLGPNITTPSELFGRIFALVEEKRSINDELQKLMRKMNVRKSGAAEIELDLGEFLPKACELAADSNKDVNEFLSEYVRNSLENGWITAS